jgi:hypothetical protein
VELSRQRRVEERVVGQLTPQEQRQPRGHRRVRQGHHLGVVAARRSVFHDVKELGVLQEHAKQERHRVVGA